MTLRGPHLRRSSRPRAVLPPPLQASVSLGAWLRGSGVPPTGCVWQLYLLPFWQDPISVLLKRTSFCNSLKPQLNSSHPGQRLRRAACATSALWLLLRNLFPLNLGGAEEKAGPLPFLANAGRGLVPRSWQRPGPRACPGRRLTRSHCEPERSPNRRRAESLRTHAQRHLLRAGTGPPAPGAASGHE